MKIGIIGAGFTGLSAAFYLSQKGHQVTVFEKGKTPGGLAIGYKEKEWKWTLEEHYHHWFTNDKSILTLAHEIRHKVFTPRPKTSSFVDGNLYQLDSPTSVLKFPKLSLLERMRMGASLAFLKFNPFWQPLENFKAEPYLKKTMGEKTYKMLWEPLMVNKLGKYARDVSLAWFWARVYKRTPRLSYPEGGFLEFANHVKKEVEKNGGVFYFDTEVVKLSSEKKPKISYKKNSEKEKSETFDAVIVTTPSSLFLKIAERLSSSYISSAKKRISIGALNLVLRLKKQFMTDGTYWLSLCDLSSPILAIVEHTNYMDKKNYKNEHIVYVGNYMETTDKRFTMTKEELLKLYDPWLKKINPDYKKYIIDYKLFHAPFAQPIIFPKYSKSIPDFKTPLKNVYLVNIEQVYPWDRGTNYAVELGKKIAYFISS